METQIKLHDLSSLTGLKSKRLHDDEMSFYFSKKRKEPGMTFNMHISGELLKKGHILLNVAENQFTGEMYLVLSSDRGSKTNVTGKENKNITVSILASRYISQLLKIELVNDFYYIIKLSENLSKTDNNSTFKIMDIIK